MKFPIQSVDVNNSWWKNPDLKIVELYPILKDKLTTINIATATYLLWDKEFDFSAT